MATGKTAIVVGGGLIGCSTAYYLSELGWSVRLLERDRIGSGASAGNCGYVCPSHVMPLSVPGAVGNALKTMLKRDSPIAIGQPASPSLVAWLTRFMLSCRRSCADRAARGRHALLAASMKQYRQLVATGRFDCQWGDRGLMMVYRNRGHLDAFEATATTLKETYGVEVRKLIGEEVLEFEPALRDNAAGGWFYPGDADVQPGMLLQAFRAELTARGVSIEEGVTVRRLAVEGGRLARLDTSSGEMDAHVTVIAAGAESPCFARPLRCKIPIQPGRGYSLTVGSPPPSPSRPIIFEDSHVAISPQGSTMRIGSTMEFAGYNRKPNPKRVALLLRATREHLRTDISEPHGEVWVGWRPMVYDGLPCIGHAPGASNVVVAAGNGMIGLATAPATGRLAAELAAGEPPHLDPAPYALTRF